MKNNTLTKVEALKLLLEAKSSYKLVPCTYERKVRESSYDYFTGTTATTIDRIEDQVWPLSLPACEPLNIPDCPYYGEKFRIVKAGNVDITGLTFLKMVEDKDPVRDLKALIAQIDRMWAEKVVPSDTTIRTMIRVFAKKHFTDDEWDTIFLMGDRKARMKKADTEFDKLIKRLIVEVKYAPASHDALVDWTSQHIFRVPTKGNFHQVNRDVIKIDKASGRISGVNCRSKLYFTGKVGLLSTVSGSKKVKAMIQKGLRDFLRKHLDQDLLRILWKYKQAFVGRYNDFINHLAAVPSEARSEYLKKIEDRLEYRFWEGREHLRGLIHPSCLRMGINYPSLNGRSVWEVVNYRHYGIPYPKRLTKKVTLSTVLKVIPGSSIIPEEYYDLRFFSPKQVRKCLASLDPNTPALNAKKLVINKLWEEAGIPQDANYRTQNIFEWAKRKKDYLLKKREIHLPDGTTRKMQMISRLDEVYEIDLVDGEGRLNINRSPDEVFESVKRRRESRILGNQTDVDYREFEAPAGFGGQSIKQITSFHQLVKYGASMNHCIAEYNEYIKTEGYVVYHVGDEEPNGFSIMLYPDGDRWILHQAHGYMNSEIGETNRSLIPEFIEEFNSLNGNWLRAKNSRLESSYLEDPLVNEDPFADDDF